MYDFLELGRRRSRTARHALLAATVAALVGLSGADVASAAAPATAAVDDTVLAGAVRRALEQEFGSAASSIWVEVYRGAVYLSGGVPSSVERARVERVASAVRGVMSVKTEFDAPPQDTKLAGR